MADLTIVPASTLRITGTRETKYAGENITVGMPVYAFNTTHMKMAITTNATTAAAVGISLHNATIEQPITYLTTGTLAMTAILTAGETYCVSNTSGKICPIGDITTGKYLTYLGYASTTANLTISIEATGVAKG